MKVRIVFSLFLLIVTSSLWGNTVTYWHDGDFMNPSNWWDGTSGTNHVPGASDLALFYSGAVATLGEGTVHTINALYLGEWCQTGLPHNSIQSMIINGSLTASTDVTIGCLNNGSPTMRGELIVNSGGTLIAPHYIILGKGNNGTIIINGGNVTVGWWLGLGCDAWMNDDVNTPGIGTIYLNDGNITASQIYMGNDSSKIIIADGVLNVDLQSRMPSFIAKKQVVAADGYTLHVDYTYNMGFGVRISATGPLKSDISNNNKVDFQDFAIFASYWLDNN
jgi:hypothetical protein